MSFQPDSRPVPGRLPLNLSSNNPFRNRAVSPITPSGVASPIDAPRPVSRNPFLDIDAESPRSPFDTSPNKMSFPTDVGAPTRSAHLTGSAAELFDNLTLGDKPSASNGARPQTARAIADGKPPPAYTATAGNRSENIPPRPPPNRRPSGSQQAKQGHRTTNSGGPGAGSSRRIPAEELDIFADPVEDSSKKSGLRRNSESSVVEQKSRVLGPENDKERHERRRRERREREKSKDGRPKRPSRKLDIIDKLDVTSIYGTGLFHHDGPFDACNPHRNRNGSRRAPMQAFPKDSLNNALGGGGPINKRPNHSVFLGNNDEEAFKDYSAVSTTGAYDPRTKQKSDANVQSATTKLEPIHGQESLGLGTSTFLDGAPASRTAMQRRDSETGPTGTGGGLGRKVSLAQKIRGINTRREYGGAGRVNGPDGIYSASAISPHNNRIPGGKLPERNNYFDTFDEEPSRNDVSEPTRGFATPRSPGGIEERFERRATADGNPESDSKANVGFLDRVKSLKGGPRKPREAKPALQLPAE